MQHVERFISHVQRATNQNNVWSFHAWICINWMHHWITFHNVTREFHIIVESNIKWILNANCETCKQLRNVIASIRWIQFQISKNVSRTSRNVHNANIVCAHVVVNASCMIRDHIVIENAHMRNACFVRCNKHVWFIQMFYVMQHAFTQFQQMFAIRTHANYMCGICSRVNTSCCLHCQWYVRMHVVVRYETFVRTRFMRCASWRSHDAKNMCKTFCFRV